MGGGGEFLWRRWPGLGTAVFTPRGELEVVRVFKEFPSKR